MDSSSLDENNEDTFDVAEAKKRFRIRKALWEADNLKEFERILNEDNYLSARKRWRKIQRDMIKRD